ncbi:hypothetical protein PRUPE_2G248300 [Prunus persica]|uniref:Protein kinase domain-containing protein n=1 Tax=Prunus persica TaxID=3760 RepID=A0A251QPF8_PRUPE|nr:hypothetical protein PRUPE_2G248300 [Prunus persica]
MDLHGPSFCAFWSIHLHVMTLLFFMNFLSPSTAANPFGNGTDRLALLKFKESILTDTHGFLNSWNDSLHFCNWYGVTCSKQHQRVAALNLEGSDLHGTIFPFLGSSTFETTACLHLTLSDNMLEGEIPVNLSYCSELSIVSFRSNRLTGKIPSELGSLTKLLTLNLGTNNLTGGIPSSLGNLSSITQLSLAYNNLADNEFKSSIPPNIGLNMPNLQQIGIGGNEFSGNIPASFSNASQFRILDITENNFLGQVPESFGNLADLQWLGLNNNNLGNYSDNDLGFITSLTNCSNLEILDMSLNNFGGVLPNSVANLSTQLTKLYLGVNQISGTIPATLENLNNLIVLGMQANLFTGSIPTSFGKFQQLQILALDENRLSGQIPSSIGNLSETASTLLISLSVGVGKLKNINAPDVSENNLTGDIPENMGDCLSLEFLYLQGNLFQGIIPSSLASLNSLRRQISFNNLEGEVIKEGAFGNTSTISLVGNTKLCGGVLELQLPACPIKGPEHRKIHSFNLEFIIALVVGCSLLFSFLLALYWRRKPEKKSPSAVSSINFLSKVSYETLYKAASGFIPSTLIGSGSFVCVYKGVLDKEGNKRASKSFMAECNAVRNIQHRNLVKILTCCSSVDYNGNEFKALVFEYMSNGSLEELNIAVDVASALYNLHDHCEPPIIHCDLKPSHVLLDNDVIAHVGDFGLARLISTATHSSENQSSTVGIKGTIGYVAPEYAIGGEPSRQGDIYSYGILVLEMFTGRRPTEEMFKDGFSLHNFVKMAMPERVMQILDPALLATVEEKASPAAATENEVNYISGYNIEIKAEEENINSEKLGKMSPYVSKCIVPILKIGLACSEESPKYRMNMQDVTRDLHHIQNCFIGVDIR